MFAPPHHIFERCESKFRHLRPYRSVKRLMAVANIKIRKTKAKEKSPTSAKTFPQTWGSSRGGSSVEAHDVPTAGGFFMVVLERDQNKC